MFQSPSKIVFLLVATVLSIAFLYGVVNGTTTLDGKDFLSLATMVFAFYFGAKQPAGGGPEDLGGK